MTDVHVETLYITGGRRVEGTPPSSSVLTPPLRRARRRNEVALLILLDLGENVPSYLYRELRDVAAQTFWSSAGSVTGALRRAVFAVNRALFEANLRATPEDRRYGGISCAALHKEEVFVAQAGPAWACSLCGGLLECFPREELPHLGSAAYVDTRLAYVTPLDGDTLLLGSPQVGSLASEAALRQILEREDVGALLDGLEQIAALTDIQVLLARWPAPQAVPALEPSSPQPEQPAPAPPPVRVRQPTGPVRRVRVHDEERAPSPPPEARPRRAPRRPPGEILRGLGQKLRGAALAVGGGALTLGRGLTKLGATALDGMRTLFWRLLPGRERRPRRRPRREPRPVPTENSRLMAALGLVILVIVTLITILAWRAYSSGLRQDQALDMARSHARQAEETNDPDEERAHWEAVLAYAASAEDTDEISSLREQAQSALDALNGVLWVDPILIHDFGAHVQPRRLVVHGQAVFVLDAASAAVHQLSLDEAQEQEQTGSSTVLVQTGPGVDQLVDMTWAGAGGARTSDGLVTLERGGSLISYEPAWYDPDRWPNRIYLGGFPSDADPVAMCAYEGKLYMLDPATSQVWRYMPDGRGYPSGPEPYFAIASPRPLDDARDMAIDGSVYVLSAGGAVGKYYGGGAVAFDVTGVPDPAPSFVALAVSTTAPNGPVILADGADERLVVLTADGTFSAQLRSRGGAFQSLQQIALDETTGGLFVLAGGRLYALPPGTFP
jgi:hypothetical protein